MAVVASGEQVETFIERWGPSGGGERSNYQLFLTELCALIGVPGPEPTVEDEGRNAYVFERRVTRQRRDGTSTDPLHYIEKEGNGFGTAILQ